MRMIWTFADQKIAPGNFQPVSGMNLVEQTNHQATYHWKNNDYN
jgi:hypothetical protein